MPTSDTASIIPNAPTGPGDTVAFVPLAMPLMFGPGAIASVLGMASFVRHPLAEFLSPGRDRRRHVVTMVTLTYT